MCVCVCVCVCVCDFRQRTKANTRFETKISEQIVQPWMPTLSCILPQVFVHQRVAVWFTRTQVSLCVTDRHVFVMASTEEPQCCICSEYSGLQLFFEPYEHLFQFLLTAYLSTRVLVSRGAQLLCVVPVFTPVSPQKTVPSS